MKNRFTYISTWVRNTILILIAVFVVDNLYAQPIANFSATPLSGCAPLVVHFTDMSTGNPNQWLWDFGTGATSLQQNPSATYFFPGVYSVKLRVTNAAGFDTLTKVAYIIVHSKPTVNIAGTNTSGCVPLTVNFQDQTIPNSGTNGSWFWDFGDGNVSNQQNPSHTYTVPGVYFISLMATNSVGCSTLNTFPAYVQADLPPVAAFTTNGPVSCSIPQTVNFQNQSTGSGVLSYQWSFGDGGTSTAVNPSHTYSAVGSYTVTLVTTTANGCSNTLVMPNAVVIGSVPPAINPPDTVCVGTTFSLGNIVPSATSASWNMGDGNTISGINPQYAYSNSGNYQISVSATYANSCASTSTTHTIVVLQGPQAAFTSNASSTCTLPYTVAFNNISTGAISYLWNFGDGTTSTQSAPSHTYTSYGNYSITLIATNANGCKDTMSMPDAVQIGQPNVNIVGVPSIGCAPYTHSFSATNSSVGTITSYFWDFGNGITSTQANPSITFTAGVYTATLIVQNSLGCRDTVTVANAVSVGSPVHSSFTANPRNICARDSIQFTSTSTDSITQWHWDFGDGSTSTQQNPMHEYSDTGYFHVTLIVANFGCRDTLVMQNYVYVKPPIAAFNVVQSCDSPYLVHIQNNSIGADQWAWDFGDGNTDTAWSPTHVYASTGTYNVQLNVTNLQSGCTHSRTQAIQIIDPQPLFFNADSIACRKQPLSFAIQNISPAQTASILWNFGDGSTGSGPVQNHGYNNAGTYIVTAYVTDILGCTDTLASQAIVVQGPTAYFNTLPGSGCQNIAVAFQDSSHSDGAHPIVSWTWNFGDGVTQSYSSPPFSHVYSTPGSYTISLAVRDNVGCIDTVQSTTAINITNPIANFVTDTASCANRAIGFNNTSQVVNGSAVWDFGDGTTSTVYSPSHTFQNNGVYNVQLIMTDVNGCKDTLIRPNVINIVNPTAAFTMSDSVVQCPPHLVSFVNRSTYYQSLHWDFGDGQFSTNTNPSHLYINAGTYVVKLKAFGLGGNCMDSTTKTIVVNGPSGSFSYQPLSGCMPHTVNFVAQASRVDTLIWDFRDGTILETAGTSISYTYVSPGLYLPRVLLKDSSGCIVPLIGMDTIKVYGVEASFKLTDSLFCLGNTVQFTNTSAEIYGQIASFDWDFGDGNHSPLENPVHSYAQAGNYIVNLTITTMRGCVDTFKRQLPITVIEPPHLLPINNLSGCIPISGVFAAGLSVADTSQVHYQWNFGNGQTSGNQNPGTIHYPNAGTYNIQLIATNTTGCADTVSSIVNAFPIPVVNAGIDTFLCVGNSFTLSPTGALTYVWGPATAGLSCSVCNNPVAAPTQSTNIFVTGTDANGCTDSDTLFVKVYQPFVASISPNDTLCLGERSTLTASGASNISWTSNPVGFTASTPSITVNPQQTTTYIATITDEKNCFPVIDSAIVAVYPIPVVHAGNDTIINVGQTAILSPTVSPDVTNITWLPLTNVISTNYPVVIVRPQFTTTYTVRVRNQGGCSAVDEKTVYLVCNGNNFFIPNTFSPNGDGSNDVFYPRGTGLWRIKSLKIFNRWGEMVFSKNEFAPNDPFAGWDGTYKDQKLSVDVYVYMIEIICDNGPVLLQKGNVALIK